MGMTMTWRLLNIGAFVLIVGVIGVVCLFFPRSVQAYAKRLSDRGLLYGGSLVRDYVLSAAYRVTLRAIGMLALAACGLVLWTIMR